MMTDATAHSHREGPIDERQPLLRHADEVTENGTIEQNGNGESNGIVSTTSSVKAPSTARILLVLGSTWIGFFLAALGMWTESILCYYQRVV